MSLELKEEPKITRKKTDKKKKYILFSAILCLVVAIAFLYRKHNAKEDLEKKYVKSTIGVNQRITGDYDHDLAVTCHNGTFVGIRQDEVISFKGIPYAVQPTGEYRWKPAPLALEDDGVYEAYYYGKSPIQTEAESERASYYEQGEECLHLNIWNNRKNPDTRKPVMVFVHGGSYGWGGTSDPIYDGQNFATAHDDVILVTIGYRTGIMGFIDLSSFPDGDEYKESGNLGLLDQVTALRWIQKNISAFGGDPENVTLFGESAGAGSASLLPLIKGTEGLFHRYIAQSGSVALTFSREECQVLTEKLKKETGAATVADLQTLSSASLKRINEKLNDYAIFPERDGVIIPEEPDAAYEAGAARDIDIMIGSNEDEMRYFIQEVGGINNYKLVIPVMYESNIRKISREDRDNIRTAFRKIKLERAWRLTEFYNETLFRLPAIAMAESHARAGGNTYMYYWKYPSAIPYWGACHAVELAYVFNNLDQTIYTGNNIDPQLAANVQDMWVNFAKTGDPSIKDLKWIQYEPIQRETMILDSTCRMEKNPKALQRELLSPLNKYYLNGNYHDITLNIPIIYRYALSTTILLGILFLAGLVIRKLRKRIRKPQGEEVVYDTLVKRYKTG